MARVVIYDSGVGGLSIHAAIKQALPRLEFVFVSDNQAHPYGSKSPEFLLNRIQHCVQNISEQLNPDLLVVACNTASTLALEILRPQHLFPIVGVVPAIKPAAEQSQSKRIAIIGTPATIAHSYTRSLITDFASHCQVLKVSSEKLVEIAEHKLAGETVSLVMVADELSPILKFEMCDKLVLACTHFPLLNNEIKHTLDVNSQQKIDLVDSGCAIASRVSFLLASERIKSAPKINASFSLTTKALDSESAIVINLKQRELPYAGVLHGLK